MESHYNLSDLAFMQAFHNCTFPADLFTHEAHLRLAWIHISTHGLKRALIAVPHDIKTYVTALGAEDKYNETLTRAAVYAVHHFMQRSKSNSFTSFIGQHPTLLRDFKSLIQSHYRHDIFNNEEARHQYLAPTLQPFIT